MLLIFGLLLLGATGAFAGLLIADNTGGPDYHVVMIGNQIATLNSVAIFLAGIAFALILGLACAMIAVGGARARRRRELLRGAQASTRPPTGEPAGPPGQPDSPQVARDDPLTRQDSVAQDAAATTAGRHSRRHLHFGHG